MTGSSARGTVHLVGSAPFATAEEMFRAAEAHLGRHLKRLPDGEVGERDSWIKWQHARIGRSPQFRLVEVDPVYVPVPPYEAVEGVASADDIDLPDLGYAAAAIDSFATFRRLTDDGVVAPDRRFQVGLPTPLSVTSVYIVPGSRALFEPAYARALGRELEAILAAIPAEKLAIQWEAAVEFALLEGVMPGHLGDDMLDGITGRLAGLVDLVPAGVEAGIHLCYGDSGHKHFCEPGDAGHLVAVANGVSAKAGRAIDWIHMPVPKERDDDGYFAPLAGLRLKSGLRTLSRARAHDRRDRRHTPPHRRRRKGRARFRHRHRMRPRPPPTGDDSGTVATTCRGCGGVADLDARYAVVSSIVRN